MEAGPLNSLTLKVVLSFVKKKKNYDLHFVWIERKMEGMNVVLWYIVFLSLVDMREEKEG